VTAGCVDGMRMGRRVEALRTINDSVAFVIRMLQWYCDRDCRAKVAPWEMLEGSAASTSVNGLGCPSASKCPVS